MPREPEAMALTEQWIAFTNHKIDRHMMRDYVVQYRFADKAEGTGHGTDQRRAARYREAGQIHRRRLAKTGYLVGGQLTMADINLLPMVYYTRMLAEGKAIIESAAASGLLYRAAQRAAEFPGDGEAEDGMSWFDTRARGMDGGPVQRDRCHGRDAREPAVRIAVALLLARGRFWGKGLVNALVHLPLVLPPVVTGFALLLLFGHNGPLGHFFEHTFGLVFAFRWTGAALAAGSHGLSADGARHPPLDRGGRPAAGAGRRALWGPHRPGPSRP